MLLFLMLPLFTNAQITITDVDLPSSGQSYYYSNVVDFLSVDVNQTGPNYSWDFSNLIYFNQDSVVIVPVSSTPFVYQFYFNNAFLYPEHYSSFAQVGQDISAMSTIDINERYDYYQKNDSTYNVVGFGANVNGIPASVKYDTIDHIYPLPLNYGVTDSTSAYYLTSIPSLGTYGQWIRRKVEVDGWGTVSTPYSSYDVIRVKTTLYQRDTIYIDQFMLGNAFDRPVSTIYEWYANNEGVPVVSVTAQSGVINEVKYLDQLHVSLLEHHHSGFNVFPNPTNDEIQLEVDVIEPMFIEIYNLNGYKVLELEYQKNISLESLEKGGYLLKVIGKNSTKCKKLIKL